MACKAQVMVIRDVDVQFLVSGRPKVKLFDMEPFGNYWWREGLTFHSRKGRLVLSEKAHGSDDDRFFYLANLRHCDG